MPSTDKTKEDKNIINNLAIIIKTAQLHHPDNIAVVNAIKKLLGILNPLLSEDSVTIELVGEFFHLNGNRIRYSMDYIFNYDFLVREFKKRELGSIFFRSAMQDEDIKTLLTALISSGFSEAPFDTLSEALEEIQNMTIGRLRKVKDEGTPLDRKKIVKKTYFNAVSLTKGVLNKISKGERVNLKKVKRIMETVVDQIIEDESMLIGMTTIKDYDEYTYFHSVNVSILSAALGHRMGLPKNVLSDLGLSALLHDIGKIEVPKEILNKTTEFTEKDWEIMMKHPIWGVHAIFKIKGIDIASMNPAISAFEHHLHYDLSGYPKIKSRITLNLFSRIIAIADQYDAITSARVYSRTPLPADKALSILIERSGTQLDPCFSKIFVNMVGIYPIGSMVMLNTNELALVFEGHTNTDFIDRPRIYIVVDKTGKKTETKNIIDLMEKDEEGNYKRTIIKTLDPNLYKINFAEYLL